MSDFSALIGRWPSLSEFASDMGVPYGQAKQWKRRGNIPSEYWQRLIDVAKERGIKRGTADGLTALAAKPAERASA